MYVSPPIPRESRKNVPETATPPVSLETLVNLSELDERDHFGRTCMSLLTQIDEVLDLCEQLSPRRREKVYWRLLRFYENYHDERDMKLACVSIIKCLLCLGSLSNMQRAYLLVQLAVRLHRHLGLEDPWADDMDICYLQHARQLVGDSRYQALCRNRGIEPVMM